MNRNLISHAPILILGIIVFSISLVSTPISHSYAAQNNSKLGITEIETPQKIKILFPNSLTNQSYPQNVNISFQYAGEEAYFAIRIYPPDPNGGCGDGGGGGGGDVNNALSISSGKTTGSENGVVKNTTITKDGNGFIQMIEINNQILCAHGGWR